MRRKGVEVVLDTSVICQDFWMRGTAFQTLQEGVFYSDFNIRVPEIVYRETVAKYAEQLRSAFEQAETTSSKLNRFLLEKHKANNLPRTVVTLVAEYDAWLKKKRGVFRPDLPIPSVPHDVCVDRAIARQSPFRDAKGGGTTGYRDFLIWRSIIERAKTTDELLVFVTANTNDFMNVSEADGGLCECLVSDLVHEGIEPGRIAAYSSIRELNERHVFPVLNRARELEDKFKDTDSTAAIEIADWMEGEFYNWFIQGVHYSWIRLPSALEGGELEEGKYLRLRTIGDVFAFQDGRALLRVEGTADVEVHNDIYREDLSSYADEMDGIEICSHYDGRRVTLKGLVEVWFNADVILRADGTVEQAEVMDAGIN